jgi:PAS domain S-box-containing protein
MQEVTVNNSNIHLDFEQAKAKHLLFKSKLRSILYGAKLTDEAPVLSQFECTVGKWIYNHALKAYGHIPEMQELEKVHADIHISARELVSLHKDGKEEEARKGLIDMEKIADHIVGLLAIVEHKLSIVPPRINIQYEGLDTSRAELNDLLKANEHLDKRIKEQSVKLITERMVLYNSFMHAPAGIAILKDDTLVYEFANAEYEKLRGRKIIIGKTVEQLFPEIEHQGLTAILKNVFSTGKPFIANELAIEINTKGDGILEKLFLNLTVQPLKDGKGNIERLLAHIIDVTEQVTARKKVEVSEEQLRIAIEGGDLGTYDLSPQKGELNWSAKTKALFGLPPDAEVNYDLFLSSLHPEDKERVYAANQKAMDIQYGGLYQNEYRTIGITDGKLRWVRSKGKTTFDEHGQPIRFTGVVQDITEEKAAKEALAYRSALLEAQNEAIPDAILIVDTKGKMISFNHHFVELWKIPEEIIKRKDDSAALKYAMTQLTDPEGFIERVNYCYSHPDEKANEEVLFKDGRTIQRYGNAIIGEDGTSYGWAWYFRNITESRKNEIEIKKALEQKDEFISIASHELKTPVTSLKGFTQILKLKFEQEENSQAVDLLSRMDKQVDKLTKLIVELLDATKIENGQLKFSKEDFDFNALVLETAEEMQRTTEKHTIKVKLVDTKLICCDKDRIGQVIINLVSNAIKYSPNANEILITSSIENDTLKLCVKDYGIGIPAEKQSHVFDRFFRVSGDKQDTFPGLGLGLFISSEIIKRHNGNLTVKSIVGEGSTFCFTLPFTANQ